MDYRFDKCSTCVFWNDGDTGYSEACMFCFDAKNYQANYDSKKKFGEFGKRVTVLEQKSGMFAFSDIYKVNIKYSDGKDFFIGWVDDDFMPILFGRARKEKLICDDIAYPRIDFPKAETGMPYSSYLAGPEDKNEIIDLRFQSFFEGGANCISALAALKQVFDKTHYTIAVSCKDRIVGLIYGYNRYEEMQIIDDFYIDYIYVHPNFRNFNLGSVLLKKMEDLARHLGFRKVSVLIQGKQEHANIVFNFNLKHGFKYEQEAVTDIGNDFLSLTMEMDLV